MQVALWVVSGLDVIGVRIQLLFFSRRHSNPFASQSLPQPTMDTRNLDHRRNGTRSPSDTRSNPG